MWWYLVIVEVIPSYSCIYASNLGSLRGHQAMRDVETPDDGDKGRQSASSMHTCAQDNTHTTTSQPSPTHTVGQGGGREYFWLNNKPVYVLKTFCGMWKINIVFNFWYLFQYITPFYIKYLYIFIFFIFLTYQSVTNIKYISLL